MFLVDGAWSHWKGWTACSVTCGGGMRERVRNCDNPKPLHGGMKCKGDGTETEQCNQMPCPGM